MLFSGRQSPGGHNVIWGTYDAMKARNPQNVLLGFVGEHNAESQNYPFGCSVLVSDIL